MFLCVIGGMFFVVFIGLCGIIKIVVFFGCCFILRNIMFFRILMLDVIGIDVFLYDYYVVLVKLMGGVVVVFVNNVFVFYVVMFVCMVELLVFEEKLLCLGSDVVLDV